MNEISVQVLGLTGTGKSTIIALFNEVLKAAGIDTKVTNPFANRSVTLEEAQRNLQYLKGKTTVTIGEVYEARRPDGYYSEHVHVPGEDYKMMPGGDKMEYGITDTVKFSKSKFEWYDQRKIDAVKETAQQTLAQVIAAQHGLAATGMDAGVALDLELEITGTSPTFAYDKAMKGI